MNTVFKRNFYFNKLKKFFYKKTIIKSCSSLSKTSYVAEVINTQEILETEPIFADKIIEFFHPKDGDVILDLTFGDGGHTKELLKKNLDIIIFTLDRDPYSYIKALEISKNDPRVFPMLGKFSDINKLFYKNKIKYESIDSVILDLGVSNSQLNNLQRGFRLSFDSNLDMRMDANRCKDSVTAKHVLNILDVNSLEKIFKYYGNEKNCKKYANSIIDSRHLLKNINSTYDLSYLINRLHLNNNDNINLKELYFENYASKIFLALRIFVNNELNELNYCLEHIRKYLKKDENIISDFKYFDIIDIKNRYKLYNSGKIACITFNELELLIVKKHFNEIDEDSKLLIENGRNYSNFNIKNKVESIRNRNYLQTPVNICHKNLKNMLRELSANLKTAIKIN